VRIARTPSPIWRISSRNSDAADSARSAREPGGLSLASPCLPPRYRPPGDAAGSCSKASPN
jgi:hypothetical protein